jgi:hypothetical protein
VPVDAATGAPYEGGACTSGVDVNLGPFRAQILRYRSPATP